MRALRFHAARELLLEEVAVPPRPAGRQVLVAPVVCGICGSDIHEYADGPLLTTVDPHPVSGGKLPQILGHEFAGRVVDVGSDVTTVSPGDRVSVMPLMGCGHCSACLRGEEHLCGQRASVGLRHPWGGMADLALIDDNQASRMPEELSWDQGALIEPAAVAWSATRVGQVTEGQTVLVTGAGPIGALAALSAAGAGARVIISEPNPARAAQAARLGCTALDPTAGDIGEGVRELAPQGADVAIECSGSPSGLSGALSALRTGGCVVQTGVPTRPLTLDVKSLVLRGLSILGSVGYPVRSWPAIMSEVASGRYPVERVISGRLGLENTVADGMERLLDPSGDALKLLIDVSSDPVR